MPGDTGTGVRDSDGTGVRDSDGTGVSGADSDGDFELRAPEKRPEPGGDFELARPSGVAAEPEGEAAVVASGVDRVTGDAVEHVPVPVADRPVRPKAETDPPVEPTSERPPVPAADRPRPLHDPDPYSTPPYGEPGPWAPAPPVQHPATTPAQGTPALTPTRQPDPYVPTAGSNPPTTGAGLPTSGTLVPTPDPHPLPTPASSTQAPAPVPAAHPAAPATGIPAAHPTVPVTAVSAAHSEASASAPAGPIPPPLPASASSVPSGQVVPPPEPTVASAAPGGSAVPGVALEAPPALPPAAGPSAAPYSPAQGVSPSAPWQNYDPWAPVPVAPLQQNGAAVLTQDQQRRRVKKVLVGGAALLALVSGGVGGVVGAYLERNGGIGAVELPQAGAESAGRAPDSVAGIAARALPSVVTLHVSGSDESGTGTGFVLDGRGHILTNNHVVEPAADDGEITVTFHSGDTAKATVVGRDSGYDLAVVKVSGVTGLKPLTLGNSDNVRVGDPVVAIGAPFDLEGTVTSGIISAKERPITAGGESGDGSDVSYVDALQTDAPINPGNSGGPLLDAQARVIGINSAIRSADSGSAPDSGQAGSIGLGFAIPVNQGKRVAEELINTGKATHPVIGVTLDMDYAGDGARVGTKGSDGGPAVTVGGPGDRAGIEAGDVITEVDGQRVHSGDELIVKTRAHRPGDRLEITVERDGKERTISLVLGSSDGD
ncbi:trypsin-like peptidase domain-containing protein [Streptomyces sp. NPDC058676]|uniref:S1C family serine protease n=1 Tax=unclassified Streptomyces TaxID=2593676 RepID=UPI003649B8BC